MVFLIRNTNKPGVERIIQDRFVCAPAMWIGVFVFLHFKGFPFFFELDGNLYIYGTFWLLTCVVVFVFDVHASIRTYFRTETTLEVYERHEVASFVCDEQPWHTGVSRYTGVIGTKCWGGVYNSGAVFGSYEIATNDAESCSCVFGRLRIRQELRIA